MQLCRRKFDCDGKCTADVDCAGDCAGTAEVDECGVCQGDGQSECWDGSFVCDVADCPAQTSTVDISYNSDVDIAGFQFNVSGASVTGASGGAAAAAGFTVSTSSSVVLGFSFSGSVIPAGSGVLTTLLIEGDSPCIVEESLVLSSPEGTTLDGGVIDCTTIVLSLIHI